MVELENYRPVSLMSILGKLAESVIEIIITKYTEEQDLLDELT